MTSREVQVAILVCRGFNNDEIADALEISHVTAKTHLRNLYRRVRVKSRILLLLRFVEDVNRTPDVPNPQLPAIPIAEKLPKVVRSSKPAKKGKAS